jgi:hypothetical protein
MELFTKADVMERKRISLADITVDYSLNIRDMAPRQSIRRHATGGVG